MMMLAAMVVNAVATINRLEGDKQKLVSACLTAKCMPGRESVRGRGGSVREFVTNLIPCHRQLMSEIHLYYGSAHSLLHAHSPFCIDAHTYTH